MKKAILSDLSRVLIFPNGDTAEELNPIHQRLVAEDPNYDFWQHFRLNLELIEFYRSCGLPWYVFTTK